MRAVPGSHVARRRSFWDLWRRADGRRSYLEWRRERGRSKRKCRERPVGESCCGPFAIGGEQSLDGPAQLIVIRINARVQFVRLGQPHKRRRDSRTAGWSPPGWLVTMPENRERQDGLDGNVVP